MSVRDSLNKKPITQAEVDALMANEPDVLPAYGGAGSMATHLKRAKRQYTPTDARARLTAGERAQFVAENQEVIYTSPEERAQIDAKLADVLNRDKVKTLFANAVRKNQPIEDAWSKAGGEGEILAGFERDGDPTGAPSRRSSQHGRHSPSRRSSRPTTRPTRTRRAAKFWESHGPALELHDGQPHQHVPCAILGEVLRSCLQRIGVLPASVPTHAQQR